LSKITITLPSLKQRSPIRSMPVQTCTIIKDADILLAAVPTMALEDVLTKAAAVIDHPVIIINVAKGFHPVTHDRLSVVIKNIFPIEKRKAVVSLIGPSHAEEVILRS
jgi:glycerol-3-phosphate dehydrogenase (NAD(P)+)